MSGWHIPTPDEGPSAEELEERAARFGRDWLACRRTADGQLDYFGDEPLRPGENP